MLKSDNKGTKTGPKSDESRGRIFVYRAEFPNAGFSPQCFCSAVAPHLLIARKRVDGACWGLEVGQGRSR